MPKFAVSASVRGSIFLGVFEAKDAEDARMKALNSNRACVSFCHQCADQCEDPMIDEDSLDVDPRPDDDEVCDGGAEDSDDDDCDGEE